MSERTGLALFVISAGAGKASEVAAKMASVTGLDLPMGLEAREQERICPDRHRARPMARRRREQRGPRAAAMLGVALKGDATMVDLSDGKAVLRISGPRARDTLAKGCSLDLHPRVFKPGSAATTPVALIDCVIWQVDETPTYDLAVPTSYAESFWSWLTASAAEYGYTVK